MLAKYFQLNESSNYSFLYKLLHTSLAWAETVSTGQFVAFSRARSSKWAFFPSSGHVRESFSLWWIFRDFCGSKRHSGADVAAISFPVPRFLVLRLDPTVFGKVVQVQHYSFTDPLSIKTNISETLFACAKTFWKSFFSSRYAKYMCDWKRLRSVGGWIPDRTCCTAIFSLSSNSKDQPCPLSSVW